MKTKTKKIVAGGMAAFILVASTLLFVYPNMKMCKVENTYYEKLPSYCEALEGSGNMTCYPIRFKEVKINQTIKCNVVK